MTEKRRELILVDEAIAALDYLTGTIRSEIAGLPSQYRRDPGERAQVEALINVALTRIGDARAASANVVGAGSYLPRADER